MASPGDSRSLQRRLIEGMVIPAHPLALTAERRLDEGRQRALGRYYVAAGAGGLAVGVHTTQFAIRDPRHDLLRPVLEIAAEVAARPSPRPLLIAGVCGRTRQAVAEAELAAELGYDLVLVSLSAFDNDPDEVMLAHCRVLSQVLPIMGFYLQPAVGGRVLTRSFWHGMLEIERLIAIKIAPFNRYHTLDVLRAVAESGRANEIALYTGNDDHIIGDLLTHADIGGCRVRFHGGLLGQWAVGTRAAVGILIRTQQALAEGTVPEDLLSLSLQLTDTNAALFDAAHGFRGCIPGIHEVLRRQGLLRGIWCLDPAERLSPGQAEEIDRVLDAYPHLHDDAFIQENRDAWVA